MLPKFKKRSEEAELMDDLNLAGEALQKNLEELEIINRRLGGHKVIIDALNHLLPTFRQLNRTITLADLGCGGGDTLTIIANWAMKNNIPVALTGIDANAFMLTYSEEKCRNFPNISLQQHDIFSPAFRQQQFDILVCSLFCHHFSDTALINLFRQLYSQARTAVLINDLHRHPLAYYSIKVLTKSFSGSYLVKNDAPLSVLRAFKRDELQVLLDKAGITGYRLRWKWAFRWQLLLLK